MAKIILIGNMKGLGKSQITIMAAGRVKLTTMMQPEYIQKLKILSINQDVTFADILETIVQRFIQDNNL